MVDDGAAVVVVRSLGHDGAHVRLLGRRAQDRDRPHRGAHQREAGAAEAARVVERGRRALPDVHAGAAAQLDVARFLEVPVGRRDRVRVQTQPARERSDRGQALPGKQPAAQDPQLELGQELVV